MTTPNTDSVTTGSGGTNPTPVPDPTGTEVIESGSDNPGAGTTGTTPPNLAGVTTVAHNDPATGNPNAAPVDPAIGNPPEPGAQLAGQPGTGTTPAATDEDVVQLQQAVNAPAEHGKTHVMLSKDQVDIFRRLWSDIERGVEGGVERMGAAMRRVF